MEFNIKYNEKLDEFTSDLSLQMRIKNYIEHHIPLLPLLPWLLPF